MQSVRHFLGEHCVSSNIFIIKLLKGVIELFIKSQGYIELTYMLKIITELVFLTIQTSFLIPIFSTFNNC